MNIYLDNAATTAIDKRVIEKIEAVYESYGNPSSLYRQGREAKNLIQGARAEIAATINSEGDEIFFTSGGTEADNWAIRGIADSYAPTGGHIICSSIEHPAILETCRALEKRGYDVTYLPVDKKGFVNPDDVNKAIRDDTFLVSVMLANNETGTIEPVKEIAEVAHEHGAIFHTDAVQGYGIIPIDVKETGIDLLSVSGHKLYGPKGTGFLYIKKGVKISPLIYGGGQERGRRAGTENVPGIIGLAGACRLAHDELAERAAHEKSLRNYFAEKILTNIAGAYIVGDDHLEEDGKRLPGNINICFPGKRAETLLIMLDMEGVSCSAGSACSTGSLEPSHVLSAMGVSKDDAERCIRFSFGKDNTLEETDRAVEIIKKIFAHD